MQYTCTSTRIRDVIRTRIADGTYVRRIPTASVLADEFGVSPGTVARAIRVLKSKGVVFSKGRHGTLISAQSPSASVRHPSVPDVGKLLTAAEVATIMRVSKTTIYRLIHAGELQCLRFGPRSFRVPERAAREYLLNNYHPPTEMNTLPERTPAVLRATPRHHPAAHRGRNLYPPDSARTRPVPGIRHQPQHLAARPPAPQGRGAAGQQASTRNFHHEPPNARPGPDVHPGRDRRCPARAPEVHLSLHPQREAPG
jgi:excisionase family DNA binding protein